MSKLVPKDFDTPAILLGGPVDYNMYKEFRAQLDRSPKEGPLVVTELSTLGGDPEVARVRAVGLVAARSRFPLQRRGPGGGCN
jgi:hypothetical protein